MYLLATIAGGVIAVLLISKLIGFIAFRNVIAPNKQIYSIMVAFFVAVILGGYGLADGGEPDFLGSSFTYGISSLVLIAIQMTIFYTTTKGKTKTDLKILGGISALLILVIAVGISKMTVQNTPLKSFEGKDKKTLSSILMQTASKLNESLPMMVDSDTRLDTSIGVNKSFRYNYTLINLSAEEIEPVVIVDAMKEKLINNVCTSEDMKFFIENDVPVTYAYYGKNGKEITAITVVPNQCKRS